MPCQCFFKSWLCELSAAKDFFVLKANNVRIALAFSKQLQHNEAGAIESVDLRSSVVKPFGAKWMINMHIYVKSNPDIIQNGFIKAGLLERT